MPTRKKRRQEAEPEETRPQINTFGANEVKVHQTASQLRKVSINYKIPRRLAPLDHIKILYKGASGKMKNAKAAPIKEKKDLMDIVRKMHANRKPVRKAVLSSMKSQRRGANRIEDSKFDSGKQEIATLEATVNQTARRYNVLVREVEMKKNKIDRLLDKMAIVQREVQSLRASENASTKETRKIAELKRRIAAQDNSIAAEKFLRDQLQHMHRRLKHNMVAYNSHINDLQSALEASTRELGEVQLLVGQLENKKKQAERELEETKVEIKMNAQVREVELQSLREEAARAQRMLDWRQERRNMRDLAEAQAAGDLDAAGEQELLNQKDKLTAKAEVLQNKSKKTYDQALTMEEAFVQIRRATGITTLEEMVEKFLGQSANKEALLEEKDVAEEHLRRVREQLAEAEERFAGLKASGVGGTEFNRDVYDKLDDEIGQLKTELKQNLAACSRLESVSMSCRLGALGLAQRLAPLTNLVDHSEENEIALTGIESLDALLRCQQKVMKMIEIIKVKQQMDPAKDKADSPARSRRTKLMEGAVPHGNNVRVDTKEERVAEERRIPDEEDEQIEPEEDEEEEVFTRESIKNESNRLYAEEKRHLERQAQKRSRRRRRQSKKNEDAESVGSKSSLL